MRANAGRKTNPSGPVQSGGWSAVGQTRPTAGNRKCVPLAHCTRGLGIELGRCAAGAPRGRSSSKTWLMCLVRRGWPSNCYPFACNKFISRGLLLDEGPIHQICCRAAPCALQVVVLAYICEATHTNSLRHAPPWPVDYGMEGLPFWWRQRRLPEVRDLHSMRKRRASRLGRPAVIISRAEASSESFPIGIAFCFLHLNSVSAGERADPTHLQGRAVIVICLGGSSLRLRRRRRRQQRPRRQPGKHEAMATCPACTRPTMMRIRMEMRTRIRMLGAGRSLCVWV